MFFFPPSRKSAKSFTTINDEVFMKREIRLLSACLSAAAAALAQSETNALPPRPETVYVSPESGETLQEAVDRAAPGGSVIAAPGIYDFGGRQHGRQGPATRVVIDKPLTVRSEAGPAETVIVGGPATRGVYLTNGARVIGFTIRHGEAVQPVAGGDERRDLSGGGVWSEPDGVLENCVVVSNRALWNGGGLFGGTALRCAFTANRAGRSGGGTAFSRLENSLLQFNRAGRYGGGALQSHLLYCTVAQNFAEEMGGGAALGTATNTVIHHNQTRRTNHNGFEVQMAFCCTVPLPEGPGNIDDEPGFKNSQAGVFVPLFDSPLIDAGTNLTAGADLEGHPRKLDSNRNGHVQPDIGAYEYAHPEADSDGDGVRDRREKTAIRIPVEIGRPAR